MARARRSRLRAGDGSITVPAEVLIDTGTTGAAELFAAAMDGNKRAELDRRANARPRGHPDARQAAGRQRPLAVDHALSDARRQPAPRKRARAERSGRRAGSRRFRSAGAHRRPDSRTKPSSASPRKRPRKFWYTDRSSKARFFNTCRHVAQWLERLLDTQEVGGSTPLVPTTCRTLSLTFESRFMSQITVTLPDGSSRSMPAGAPVRDVAESISPDLAKAALAALVDGKLVDLSYPLEKEAAVRIVTDRSPEALRALSSQHGTPSRRGGDESVPRRAVRHWSGDRRRLLSTTSSCRVRSSPRISTRSRRR